MNFPDVADVVTFLVSDRSSYITGQSFEVNGMVPITPGGTSRKIGWVCAARFMKPLPYFRPTSVIFPTQFQI